MMKLVTAITTTALLTACAGTPFKWDDARKIRAGMSTQEVTAIVGTPNAVKAQGEILRYVWVYVSSFEGTRTLVVDFKDGKAIKAPPIPDEFK